MSRDRTQPAVLTATILCTIGFVIVAWLVSAGATEELDRSLMLLSRVPGDVNEALGPDWFEEALAEVTTLGGYTILVIISALALGMLLLLRETKAAAYLAAALVGGSIVSSLLKLLFARPRPDIVEHMDQTFTSSFPSAHAMVSTLAYLTLAAVCVRFVRNHSTRAFVIVAALLLAFAIGASRVYLGVHWPSDVVAGWFAGAAWAGLAWLGADMWTRSFTMPGRIGHSDV